MRRSPSNTIVWASTVLALVTWASLAGCAGPQALPHAGRTTPQKEQLTKPGKFGTADKRAAADTRRAFFDFWNEEIIRQDIAVGTVFMGDSITEFWELAAYFRPSSGVILNRGISGDLAVNMDRRFDADVIQLRPRNVVILAGTNDVARMLEAKKSDQEIVQTVVRAVESMLDKARGAGVNVLVCSIVPTNPDTRDHPGKARLLPQINEQIKATAAAKGCVYVDYWNRMRDPNGALLKTLARDGLHPHYAGYEIMAATLHDAAKAHGLKL
ncbi:MAG TPA: GDSL-type esterase/lipase family protein [Phycisphaerae bacterium]|nr:GDSL-type esterase/lipase family protein [Phycisphaerae bacterium]HRY67169.1 GDSL-type esterase/lipase family protein [Phycisphaerae bacterium]HSA26462.1 GDSL-type esterase/lipase family protein [Phycisphaerae bacterium]